jgi:prophage regulatory protein
VPLDVLDRLCLDPGTRTLGELMQEREWAVWEIRRLSLRILRMRQRSQEKEPPPEGSLDEHLDPSLNAQRLLRLKEVSTMIGLRWSAIYKYVAEGRFPAPIKVGIRSVRWKLTDVLAWRSESSK